MPSIPCRAALRFEKLWRSAVFRLHCRIWGNDVTAGSGLGIHRRVTVKTQDGGKVIIGNDCYFEDDTYIAAKGGIIEIGDHAYIGHGVQIVAHQSIRIGHSSLISSYAVIRDADHGTERGALMRLQDHTTAPVNVGNDVWLGNHVVVTSGVTLGDGAVIGANAVVTRDIETETIAVGVPARPLRQRILSEQIT